MQKIDLCTVADTGNRLETLKVLLRKVAQALEMSESGRDIAALARQMQIIMSEIDALEAEASARNPELTEIINKHRDHTVRENKADVEN